jgi:hypothetical protein
MSATFPPITVVSPQGHTAVPVMTSPGDTFPPGGGRNPFGLRLAVEESTDEFRRSGLLSSFVRASSDSMASSSLRPPGLSLSLDVRGSTDRSSVRQSGGGFAGLALNLSNR